MSVAPESLLHCSFCSKDQTTVKKLIAGPGVYICDECIALCNGILDEEGFTAVDREHRDALSEEVLLAHLRRISGESDELVEHLRGRGVAWERISAALRR